MAPRVDREDLKGIPYELFMLGLAVLSIANLVLLSVFEWGIAALVARVELEPAK